MTAAAKLTAKLVKSPIGYTVRQKETVRSLGFTKLNQERTLPDNPSVRAMIGSIPHLVQIVPSSGQGN